MPKLIIHTASLYYWFSPYEQTLDERIHAALEAGLDGVEISDGPSIVTWRPHPDTVRRLRGKTVTVHAELYPHLGVTLDEWAKAIQRLPFSIANTVFHPDELTPDQFPQLAQLPFPASIENMDRSRDDWRKVKEVERVIYSGVGFTYDTAHAEENKLPAKHFKRLWVPAETHLSIPNQGYFDFDTAHAMTHLRPNKFPEIPSTCPIVTLEGVVPPTMEALENEVRFVRSKL
jgi:hypothetical protein